MEAEERGKMLIQAAIYDNAELMSCLLCSKEKQYLDMQDACGRTAVYTAVSNKSLNCLKLLLEEGANPDIPANTKFDCMTPLCAAAVEGKVDCLMMLLEFGADPDKKDASGLTALELAETANNQKCIDAFYEAKAKRDHDLQKVAHDLFELCSSDVDDIEHAKKLFMKLGLRAKEFIDASQENDETVLYRACRHSLHQVASLLLQAGIDPLIGKSPLYVACTFNNLRTARELLMTCPKLVKKKMEESNACQLPIHGACCRANVEMVDLLLNFDYPEDMMETFTHEATGVEYKAAFDINAVDINHQTPLYYACLSDNPKPLVTLLLEHKVSGLARDQSSEDDVSQDSPSSMDPFSDEPRRVCPVVVDCRSVDGTTPLIAAARLNLKDVVKLLVQYGADLNISFKHNARTYTALLEACEQDDISRMRLLLDLGAKDEDQLCLASAQLSSNGLMTSTLLRYLSYVDREHQINREALKKLVAGDIEEDCIESIGSIGSLGGHKVPTMPVFVNWYKLNLATVSDSWLISSCYFHNPKINYADYSQAYALFALTKIDISNNMIKRLPSVMFSLQSLQDLNASYNKIEVLSPVGDDFVWKLPALRIVNLKDNRLQILPSMLFTHTGLEKLDVSHNMLVSVPVEMWNGAIEIDLSNNLLRELPERSMDFPDHSRVAGSPGYGSKLGPINDDGSLAGDDDVFKNVFNVQKNNIWHHLVTESDEDMSSNVEDKQLKELVLSGNQIMCLPSTLPCMAPYLEKLYMSKNQLKSAGTPVNYPSSLKLLNLSHNQIFGKVHFSEAKDALRHLTTGGSCSVDNFSVSTSQSVKGRTLPHCTLMDDRCAIHQRHKELKHLKTLDLSNNSIDELYFYNVAKQGFLDSGGSMQDQNQQNPVTNYYPLLSHLDVSNNKLSELPPLLGELSNLGALMLGQNRITTLPPQMGRLKKLWTLNVKDCPLEGPLKALFEQPNYRVADITGFLKSILKRDKEFHRMKLMFVGVQDIGKTTLLQHILRGSVESQTFGKLNMKIKEKKKGKPLSTVGVDIGLVTLSGSRGAISFSTWDFGGQKEYYATHQYFLSKRALYLLLWKITDGEKAIYQMKKWLINIQMRAPNSVVIIVGTHLDQVKRSTYPKDFLSELQQRIDNTFIKIHDPASKGYPRVVLRMEVNLSGGVLSRSNVTELCKAIYDEAWKIMEPGSKTRLLEQKVPASYVELGDIVAKIVDRLRSDGKQPVLSKADYEYAVMEDDPGFDEKSPLTELHQATQFLHENVSTHTYLITSARQKLSLCMTEQLMRTSLYVTTADHYFCLAPGVLLHYKDVGLKNLYFLDPQWLCKLLARVIAVREVNGVHKCGNMQIDGLALLLKNNEDATLGGETTQKYLIDLLQKFELALIWNQTNLLIPSLLPTEQELVITAPDRIPLCINTASAATVVTNIGPTIKHKTIRPPQVLAKSTFYRCHSEVENVPSEITLYARQPSVKPARLMSLDEEVCEFNAFAEERFVPNPLHSIHRLVLMTFFPSGFWARLITRLLGDKALARVAQNLYKATNEMVPMQTAVNCWLKQTFATKLSWECWQTGLRLMYDNQTILQVKEVVNSVPGGDPSVYYYCKIKNLLQKDDVNGTLSEEWCEQSLEEQSVLEIEIPNANIVLKKSKNEHLEEDLEMLKSELRDLMRIVTSDEKRMEREHSKKKATEEQLRLHEERLKVALDRIQDADRNVEEAAKSGDRSNLKERIEILCREKEHAVEEKKKCEEIVSEETKKLLDINKTLEILTSKFADVSRRCDKKKVEIDEMEFEASSEMEFMVEPSIHTASNILNRLVDHIDTLLEDWFPDIGSRFARSTMGNLLVTRLAPCTRCYVAVAEHVKTLQIETRDSWHYVDVNDKKDPLVMGNISTPGHNDASKQTDWPTLCCFMVELCMLYSYKQQVLKCEQHQEDTGEIHVAPDLVFHDLAGDGYIVSPESFQKGSLLGHGAFGFVFRGKVTKESQKMTLDVAVKMLEPEDPGDGVDEDVKHYYKSLKSKWMRDPLQLYCDAYTMIRREVGIMLCVIHPNVVSLIGIIPKPISMVLELAPLGALDGILKNFKRNDSSLPINALKNIIVQVSSAMDFLHCTGIIYRDLKAENVLVWQMPDPRIHNPSHPILVKLADYGISRSASSTGARGSAGTPPYMAPEILEHAGNETYTEKADCYSFGIFIYELLSLNPPFHKHSAANLRLHIIQGGRPAITYKEARNPTNVLDLMVMCWSDKPSDRPTMKEICSMASAMEFCHLKEAVPLPDVEGTDIIDKKVFKAPLSIMCACSKIVDIPPHEDTCPEEVDDYFTQQKLRETCKSEIWIAGYIGYDVKMQVLLYENAVCMESKTLDCNLGNKIQVMCVVKDTLWVADDSRCIHVFSAKDSYREVLKFQVFKKSTVTIEDMRYYKGLEEVYVGLSNGTVQVWSADNELTQVLKRTVVSGRKLFCCAVVYREENQSELWCGLDSGYIHVMKASNEDQVIAKINHYEPADDEGNVQILVTTSSAPNSAWSYVYPGFKVFHWDAESKKIKSILNCSKTIPQIDKFNKTYSGFDGTLEPVKCQVTAMNILHDEIYVGTMWGCIIVADKITLWPLAIFRCHGDESCYVKAILPITPPKDEVNVEDLRGNQVMDRPLVSHIVSVGKQYRPMRLDHVKSKAYKMENEDLMRPHLLTWLAEDWRHY